MKRYYALEGSVGAFGSLTVAPTLTNPWKWKPGTTDFTTVTNDLYDRLENKPLGSLDGSVGATGYDLEVYFIATPGANPSIFAEVPPLGLVSSPFAKTTLPEKFGRAFRFSGILPDNSPAIRTSTGAEAVLLFASDIRLDRFRHARSWDSNFSMFFNGEFDLLRDVILEDLTLDGNWAAQQPGLREPVYLAAGSGDRTSWGLFALG